MTPRRRPHDQDPAPVVVLLVLVALLGAAVMAGYASGCGPVREKGRDVVSGLVARAVPAGDPGFEDLRATMLGGMVFKTAAGDL